MRKILFFLLFSFSLHALSLTENGQLKPAAQKLLDLFEIDDPSAWIQAGKERWEMERLYEDKRDQAMPLLTELQCVDEIRSGKEHYDYALVLGATGPVMQSRLDFLYEEWLRGIRFDQIVLLTGDRNLDSKIETIPEGLKNETELLLYHFDRHPLKNLIPTVVIDSPKQILEDGTIRRPTTISTVIEWLKTDPKPGCCLAVSTQPFVGYQEAVIRSVVPKSFEVEAIGPAIGKNYPLSIYLDNFAKWLKYEQTRHYN